MAELKCWVEYCYHLFFSQKDMLNIFRSSSKVSVVRRWTNMSNSHRETGAVVLLMVIYCEYDLQRLLMFFFKASVM